MSVLRAIHRWFSIVVALFFVLLTVTGFWLDFAPDPLEHVGPSRLSDAAIEQGFTRALVTVRESFPHSRLGTIFINVASDHPFMNIGFLPDAAGAAPNGRNDLTIDPRTGGLLPPMKSLHGTLLQLHSTLFLGLTGRWLFLAIGLALLYLLVSGLIFYADMPRLRFARGKRAPFWPSRGLAAAGPFWDIHRWIAPLAGLFLLAVAGSGVLMQSGPTGVGLWGGTFGPAGVALTPPPTIVPPDMTDAQLQQVLARGVALAAAQEPHPERLINLDFNGNGPSTHMALAYGSDSLGMYSRIWDARTWQPRPQIAPFRLFFWLLRLHRGDLFHGTGVVLNMLCAAALLLLTLTGSVMYLLMLLNRRKQNHTGVFWR